MTEPVVVLVGAGARGYAVLDVMRDWSALGLLHPFLFVHADDVADGRGSIPGMLVVAGVARQRTVTDHLADVGKPTVIRVCALDPLDGSGVMRAANVVAEGLGPAAPLVPVTRVRAILPLLGDAAADDPQPALGWHTVVLSPEDSPTPATARVLLTIQDDPVAVAMHETTGLAGVLGMWGDLPRSVLDGLGVAPDGQVMLARSYFQHIDAGHVDVALRNATLDVGGGLPAILRDGNPLPWIENEAAAASSAAEGFIAIHPEIGPSDRVSAKRPPKTRKGLAQALRELWGFFWGALLRAPGEIANRAVAGVATRVASAGQSFVYGQDSATEVVVRGRLPDGRLASLADVEQANAQISSHLGAPGKYREGRTDLAHAWRDFVEIGLTLADGRHRVDRVAQPEIGSSPAVVRRAALIAPSPQDTFRSLPPHVSSQLDIDHIDASDLQRTAQVRDELDRQSQQGVLALDMARARDDLDEWRRTVQEPSYTGQVGLRLQRLIAGLRTEIAGLVARLAAKGDDIDPASDAFAKRAARRARWTKGIIVPTIGVVGALIVSAYFGWVQGEDAAGWSILAVVLGVAAVLVIFFFSQRDLKRLLEGRQWEDEEAKAARENLGRALSDLDRTLIAYRQYSQWATLLGAFLQAPFGPQQPVPAEGSGLGGDLPRAFAVGIARTQPDTIAREADRLRQHVFLPGWLDLPFHALLRGSPEPGQTQALSGSKESLLFGDTGAPGGELHALARQVSSFGVGPAAGDAQWRTTGALVGQVPDQLDALLEGAQWSGHRSLPTGPAPLTAGDGELPFDSSVLKPEYRLTGATEIDPFLRSTLEQARGLSRTVVLTQFGVAFHPHQLGLGNANATAQPPHPDPWGGGPAT